MRFSLAFTPVLACVFTMSASAVEVRVTVRNLAADDGVALSPIILGAHDESVDLFTAGMAASAGVEDVAELGSAGMMLQDEITAMQASAVATAAPATTGGFGPGILIPNAEASVVLSLDPADNRYLSYLSMVVPSNDSFIGNDDPTAVELFDAAGAFVAQDFLLTGGAVWDAGTEVNGLIGPAYVAGATATDSPAEDGTVHLATTASSDLTAQFGDFLGAETPPGTIFNTIPPVESEFVSFSFAVVPEPGTIALGGLAALSFMWIVRKVR